MDFKPHQSLNRRYLFTALFILTSLWLWVSFRRPYSIPPHHPWESSSNTIIKASSQPQDIFEFPVLESEAIKSVCGATAWNSSIVFLCNQSVGGIGNVRNSILNCVRYAIAAGASLVVPRIVVRDSQDISQIRTGQTTEMEYMFDVPHFLNSIRLSCPDLKIHKSIREIKNVEKSGDPIGLLPEEVVNSFIPITGLPKPEAWRDQFYNWLEQYSSPNVTSPFVIDLKRSYLQYPIYSDGTEFAHSFGSILKFRSDARRLATKVMVNLAKTYSLHLDFSQDILKEAYFAAHLRTEKDAVEAWPAADWEYGRYETQSRLYLSQVPRSNTSLIYVASGNATEVSKLSSQASALNYTVTTKSLLLSGRDLWELETLAWDQQGLVDFLVMQKASDFAGVGHSSFAWNVALKRHVLVGGERGFLDGPEMLSDSLSQVYGRPRGHQEYAACLWP